MDRATKKGAIAGFAAGLAMMIGGALGAISQSGPEAQTIEESANPMIGGQAMLAGRSIVENIAASPLHARLAAALQKSGMAPALSGKDVFTLFAPTDAAFAAAPDSQNPRKDALKDALARRMRYLIVPGRYDSQALLRAIGEADGEARLHTMAGGVLVARMNGPTNITLMDEKGQVADIAIYDVRAGNGVIHVVDHVLEPSDGPRQLAVK